MHVGWDGGTGLLVLFNERDSAFQPVLVPHLLARTIDDRDRGINTMLFASTNLPVHVAGQPDADFLWQTIGIAETGGSVRNSDPTPLSGPHSKTPSRSRSPIVAARSEAECGHDAIASGAGGRYPSALCGLTALWCLRHRSTRLRASAAPQFVNPCARLAKKQKRHRGLSAAFREVAGTGFEPVTSGL